MSKKRNRISKKKGVNLEKVKDITLDELQGIAEDLNFHTIPLTSGYRGYDATKAIGLKRLREKGLESYKDHPIYDEIQKAVFRADLSKLDKDIVEGLPESLEGDIIYGKDKWYPFIKKVNSRKDLTEAEKNDIINKVGKVRMDYGGFQSGHLLGEKVDTSRRRLGSKKYNELKKAVEKNEYLNPYNEEGPGVLDIGLVKGIDDLLFKKDRIEGLKKVKELRKQKEMEDLRKAQGDYELQQSLFPKISDNELRGRLDQRVDALEDDNYNPSRFNEGGIVKKYADGGRIEQLLEQAKKAGQDVAENTPPQLPADVQEKIEMQKVRDKLMGQGAAERPSGSVGIKKPKAPPMEDFEFQRALRMEMDDVAKKAAPLMEKASKQAGDIVPDMIEAAPKTLSPSRIRSLMALKNLGGKVAGLAGPIAGAGIAALASGDAQAGLGELMGGSEAVGEGSDIIPNRPMHDVEIEKALQDRPELLMKFRRAKALKEMSPDMKKKLKPELYADGGIPGLSIGETGEEDYINQDQQTELDAASRGDLEQGILDESGPIPTGVVESRQEAQRIPSQDDILSEYQKLKEGLSKKKERENFSGPSFGAALTDSLQTLSNIVNRDVLSKDQLFKPTALLQEKKSFEAKQAELANQKANDDRQKIELFKLYNTLANRKNEDAFQREKFDADRSYKEQQARISEEYRKGMLDQSAARRELDKAKFDYEKNKKSEMTPYQQEMIGLKKQELEAKKNKSGSNLTFEEKERKKAEIKDEFKQKEESRKIEQGTKKDQKKKAEEAKRFERESDNIIDNIDKAIALTKSAKEAGGWTTGPIAGRLPSISEKAQDLEQAYAKISFDNFVEKARGMSKAFDSEKEREFYEKTQPNMKADETINLKRLEELKQRIMRTREDILNSEKSDSMPQQNVGKIVNVKGKRYRVGDDGDTLIPLGD